MCLDMQMTTIPHLSQSQHIVDDTHTHTHTHTHTRTRTRTHTHAHTHTQSVHRCTALNGIVVTDLLHLAYLANRIPLRSSSDDDLHLECIPF